MLELVKNTNIVYVIENAKKVSNEKLDILLSEDDDNIIIKFIGKNGCSTMSLSKDQINDGPDLCCALKMLVPEYIKCQVRMHPEIFDMTQNEIQELLKNLTQLYYENIK